jgi:hypothetical protein
VARRITAHARRGKPGIEYANELGLDLDRGSMGEFLSNANVSMGRAMVRSQAMEREQQPRK